MRKKILLPYFICIFITLAHANSLNWQQLTQQALTESKQILIENTVQYIDKAPNFMAWLNNGYAHAMELASKVTSESGYDYALAYYTHGFDPHIHTISELYRPVPFYYAGMLLRKVGNDYQIFHITAGFKTPPVGAKLLSCQGEAPAKIIQQQIIPFYFSKNVINGLSQAAPLIFFDGNPFRQLPKHCIFFVNGKKQSYTLQ